MIESLETFLILDSSGRKTDLLYTIQKLSACRLCICISGPVHPPKVKYSLLEMLLLLVLMEFPFRMNLKKSCGQGADRSRLHEGKVVVVKNQGI